MFKNLFTNERKIWSLILVFTLFPFVIISFFNLPMGDDFIYGAIGKDKSPVYAVSYWYHNWGGRYTQQLLSTILNPLSYHSQGFFWVPPLLLILGICSSVFVLIKVISGKNKSSTNLWTLTSSVLFLVFNLMPEIGETLYWISGAYTYQIGNIFFIVFVAIVFKLTQTNSLFKTLLFVLLASILIFLIAGTNEVSMLYMFGFSFLFLLQQSVISKKIVVPLFLFLIACISCYISISAPGNFVRASHTGGMLQNIPKAILESFMRAAFYLLFWLPSTFLLSLINWKQIGSIASGYTKTRAIKRDEVFMVIIGFCLTVSCGFFPSLTSTGWNTPRSVAPIFIVFLIFYFGIIIYYYDFFSALILKNKTYLFSINNIVLFFLLVAFSNKHNIMNAYVDIFSLKAFKYNKEVTTFYNEFSTDKSNTIYAVPLNAKPSTLPIRWPNYYNTLVNMELEMYFHKKVEMKINSLK